MVVSDTEFNQVRPIEPTRNFSPVMAPFNVCIILRQWWWRSGRVFAYGEVGALVLGLIPGVTQMFFCFGSSSLLSEGIFLLLFLLNL